MAIRFDDLGVIYVRAESFLYSVYVCPEAIRGNLHPILHPSRDIPYKGGRRGIVALAHFERMKNRSEEHTSELQSRGHLVCRLLLEKKNQSSSSRQQQRVYLLSE